MAPIKLTDNQQRVFNQITEFLSKDNPDDTFILKGYAGTGKTTLAGFITSYLNAHDYRFMVMAPTGRAAKVIRNKVGLGYTIHSSIYSPNVECYGIYDNYPKKSYALRMYYRNNYDTLAILIDESSMISDKKDKDNFFKADGSLLADLFTFARESEIPKIIFIGDNAQLPPVSCRSSYALDADYLRKNYQRKVEVAELTEVLRQKGDSGILKEATEMRLSLKVSDLFQREHTIEANGKDILEIDPSEIPMKFVESTPTPTMGKSIVISYTNKLTNERNLEIREQYFGRNAGILEVGEIILICNNTMQNDIQLFNGDFAQVLEIGECETHVIDVLDRRDQKIKKIELTYRLLKIRLADSAKSMNIIILENYIHEKTGQLPDIVRNALYIDFCKRHQNLKEGTDEFKIKLRKDPLFNCVHAKYGYAITCHKSQGGEWDTVFVDYSKKNGKLNDDIRWAYTATTRASRLLYITNPPEHRIYEE